MMRKRRNAAFSLFSFQDIITAVTAILILILLIMTLSLISQKKNAAITDPSASRKALDELTTDLLLQRKELRGLQESLKQNQKDQQSRTEIESEITSQRQKLSELQTERDTLAKTKKTNERIEIQLDKKISEMVGEFTQLVTTEGEIDQLKQRLTKVNQRNIRERERQKEQLDRSQADGIPVGDTLIFNVGDQNGLQPWLLNVSSNGLTAHQLGVGNQVPLGNEAESIEFSKWLSSRSSDRDHCLVLVRPSGIKLLRSIEERLEITGLPFGIDLIAEDASVRDSTAEMQNELKEPL